MNPSLSLLRLQGFIFVSLAVLTVLISLFLAPLAPSTTLLFASLMIVALGVPHGALDPIFAVTHKKIKTKTEWVIFLSGYLLLSAAVVGFWKIAPQFFLLVFLGLSIFHFSGDLTGNATLAERLFYGGSVIVLPALIHQAELLRIFSILSGSTESLFIVKILELTVWPWLICLLVVAIKCFQKDRQRALEMLSVALLMVSTEPLLGFTVFFCAMHSARHILRTQHYAQVAPKHMAKIAAGPMVAVLIIGLVLWRVRPEIVFEESLLQIIFVGLAALTVPHMLLVERVRLSGWKQAELS